MLKLLVGTSFFFVALAGSPSTEPSGQSSPLFTPQREHVYGSGLLRLGLWPWRARNQA